MHDKHQNQLTELPAEFKSSADEKGFFLIVKNDEKRIHQHGHPKGIY